MRIGFFSDCYWPRVDGVTVLVDLMKQALEQRGHEVYVICPEYPDAGGDDHTIIRTRGFDPLKFSNFTSRIALADPRDFRRVKALQLDIVHSHTQYTAGLMARSIARSQGIPHISSYHTHLNELIKYFPYSFHLALLLGMGFDVLYSRRLDFVKANLRHLGLSQRSVHKRIDEFKRIYFQDVDVVIANSDHVAAHLASLDLPTQVALVKNGIDITQFSGVSSAPHDKTLRIVYPARLSAEKRQDAVIEALAELRRNGVDAYLDIAGDGPHRGYCGRLVEDLGLQDVVTFHGEISQSRVHGLLTRSNVGVLASYGFDTYPLTMLEYLAAGLPVVYCDPHFDDMGSSQSMIRTTPDSHSIAEALASLTNAKQRRIMGIAARADAAKHDVVPRAVQLEAIYQTAVMKKRALSGSGRRFARSRTPATDRD